MMPNVFNTPSRPPSPLFSALKRLGTCKEGATAIEYALIAALIAVVIVGAVTTLGDNLGDVFTSVSDSF